MSQMQRIKRNRLYGAAESVKKTQMFLVALTLTGFISLPSLAEANGALDTIEGQTLKKTDWQIEKPTYVQDSTITADSVSFKDQTYLSDNTGAAGNTDWQNYPNQAAPFQLDYNTSLKANQRVEIANLKVGQTDPSTMSPMAAFSLAGASVAVPTLDIHDISSAEKNTNRKLIGLSTSYGQTGDSSNPTYQGSSIKADTISIRTISTNSAGQLIGANMGAVNWEPSTKNGEMNLSIQDIHNEKTTPTIMDTEVTAGNVAYGMLNDLSQDPSFIKNVPFTVSGTTTIGNITADYGSAVGTYVVSAAADDDQQNNYVRFHQLDMSGIQGSDISIGLYGGVGKIRVENAIINMTGKNNEYAGLYTASVPDFTAAKVKEFALAGPYEGSIYMDNAAGRYTINGNVLADQANHQLILQAMYNMMKSQLSQSGFTDEQIQEQLKPYEEQLEQQKKYVSGNINLGGRLSLYGDVYAKNGGTVNLHLAENSTFEGQADSYTDFDAAGSLTPRTVNINDSLDDTAFGKWNRLDEKTDGFYQNYGLPKLTEGTINITMDPGSTWTARGKSFITSLDFNGGGLVDTRKGHGVSVNIEKLTGNGGTFLMDFSRDPARSDMLYIKDISSAGTQNIQGYLLPGTKPEELKGMRFATTGGDDYKRGTGKFTVSLTQGQGVNNVSLVVKNEKFDPTAVAVNESFNGGKNGMGTYKLGNDYVTAVFSGKEYTHKVPDMTKVMQARQTGETYLDDKGNFLPEYMKEETIENPVKEGTNWYIDTAVTTPSDSGKIIKKSSQLDYTNAIYGIYTDNLNKRLGEARYSADGDGLWTRIRHDKLGRENTYGAKNTMDELGYDWKREETSFGRHVQGMAFDYMNGTVDFKEVNGHGEDKRYGFWLYDTRLGNHGHYTDLIAKYGRLTNKYDLYPEAGDKVHGDYKNNYFSLSFEYGRKKDLGSSWYVESQGQLQYTHLSNADFTTSQGTDVHLSGVNSLISRLGFRFGWDTGRNATFYMNLDWLHEFLGDQDIFAVDSTGIMDVTGYNRGSWYNWGAGLSTHVGRNTYLFIQGDHAFGQHMEHTWSFEAGANFRF